MNKRKKITTFADRFQPHRQQMTTTDTYMKRFIAAIVLTVFAGATLFAQQDTLPGDEADEHLLTMNAEARVDYERTWDDGHARNDASGFRGKYIAIKAQGTIMPGLTYTWRQRLSRVPTDGSFWSQTDVMNLSYKFKDFDFGAGKQIVAIGGYEYDQSPINLFSPNLFITNVACYQFGASVGYQIGKNDHLTAQVAQSMFASPSDRNLYAYSLMWNGSHRFGSQVKFETIWSVNEMEYEHGKYANYVALGNQLTLFDKLILTLDAMTRTYPDNNIFKNNTFMGQASYDFTPKFRVTLKASYDCNRGVNLTTHTEVARGTQYAIGGGVLEYYPVKSARHLLRLHASCFYGKGTNNDKADIMQDKTLYGSVGLTWHMNFLATGRPLK